jgi:hypothetical protein
MRRPLIAGKNFNASIEQGNKLKEGSRRLTKKEECVFFFERRRRRMSVERRISSYV